MEKQKHRDTGTRRLPGPAHADWAKGQCSGGSLRIVSGLAANTNSIICDGSGEPETANGCPVLHGMRGPSAVRHSCATLNPDQRNARSPERAQRPRVFPLTSTYMDVGKPEPIPLHRLSDIAAAGHYVLHTACWRRLRRCCLAVSILGSRSV